MLLPTNDPACPRLQALFAILAAVMVLVLHLTLWGPLKRRWKNWEATLVSPEELRKREEERVERWVRPGCVWQEGGGGGGRCGVCPS